MPPIPEWLSTNWFSLLQSTGIIASLLFTAYTLYSTNRTLRLTNLFHITQYHREIWGQLFTKPELRKILDSNIKLEDYEISEDERLFITLIILHLSATFQAIKSRAIIPIEGLDRDIIHFFSRPIPRKVWSELKKYQNRDFAEFVENIIRPFIHRG